MEGTREGDADKRERFRLPLDPAFVARGRQVGDALKADFHSASPAETILLDLVADEMPVMASLLAAQSELAARLELVFDKPSHLLLMTRALKGVTEVQHAISKRIENLLGAATNMRAQRGLLSRQNEK